MSTKAPTISLKFDDGSGTFPIDLSSRLNQNGVSYQPYGRADDSTSTGGTNTLSIRLKNNDGALSSGASQISVGQTFRLTYTVGATTVDQFTGRVQAAVNTWQGGPGKRADLLVTAVDLTAELNRRPMRSMLKQEILLDRPTAYYTLGEAEGSTSAGDTSGNASPPLTIAGSGVAPTFGTGIGPTDGLPAASFAGGMYLSASEATLGTGSWSVAAFFSTTTTPGIGLQATIVDVEFGNSSTTTPSHMTLAVNSTQQVFGQGPVGTSGSGSVVVTDGAVHCAVLTYDGTSLRLYIDGALDASGTSVPATVAANLTSVGGGAFSESGTDGFVGVISHVALFSGIVLSAGRVAAYAAALTGFSETTDARLTRLASYLGRTATTSVPSGQVMAAQATSGQPFLSAMEAVAEAEGGVLLIDGSGNIQMQGRYYRGQQTAAVLSLTGKDVDPSTAPSLDDTQVINKVTVTRSGGAEQIALDQASIDDVGEYPTSLDLSVDTDAHALGRAQWDVSKHASPGPRMPSVTFDMLVGPNREALLGAKIGDRVALTAMPSQQFAGLGDLTIEGWADSLSISGSDASWKRTVNFLPWSLFEVFILDSATYGVLDSAVPIGY